MSEDIGRIGRESLSRIFLFRDPSETIVWRKRGVVHVSGG